jgi:broad specificity phosphatase PhoE
MILAIHGNGAQTEMKTFYIIRHAEKEKGDFYNPVLRHQDQAISQKGQQEAQKLCCYFADKLISAIYVSAYQRTRQTIEPLARQRDLTPVIDERLNEIDNGYLEGLTEPELQTTFPEIWKAYMERKSDFRFPGGETGEEAQQRIMQLLKEKKKQRKDKHIILVTHEGLIRVLMCAVMQIPVYKRWNFHVDTCGITELVYQPDYKEWKLIRFNQICL